MFAVQTTEESIDDNSCPNQLCYCCQRSASVLALRLRNKRDAEIRPCRRNHRGAAIGQRKKKIERAMPVLVAENVQALSLERMPLPDDANTSRQILDVGSMSCNPSTPWIMLTSGRFSKDG